MLSKSFLTSFNLYVPELSQFDLYLNQPMVLFGFFFYFGMEKSNFILEHFDRFFTSWRSLLVIEESSLSWPIPLLCHYNSSLCCLSKANAEVPT